MSSHRHERVRELLKRKVGEAVRRELPVNQAGLVSVNDIELSGDMRIATVFVSILGSSDQQKQGLTLLQKSRSRLQGLVAKAIILKYTPQLRFVVDESATRGDRIVRLLEELERTSPAEPES